MTSRTKGDRFIYSDTRLSKINPSPFALTVVRDHWLEFKRYVQH
jgi:hypothetical protein